MGKRPAGGTKQEEEKKGNGKGKKAKKAPDGRISRRGKFNRK